MRLLPRYTGSNPAWYKYFFRIIEFKWIHKLIVVYLRETSYRGPVHPGINQASDLDTHD